MPLRLADPFGETRAPGDAQPPKRLRAVARENMVGIGVASGNGDAEI